MKSSRVQPTPKNTIDYSGNTTANGVVTQGITGETASTSGWLLAISFACCIRKIALVFELTQSSLTFLTVPLEDGSRFSQPSSCFLTLIKASSNAAG